MPIDYTTPTGRFRLLVNDVADDLEQQVFTDFDIAAFLDLEGGSVKRAAAQAIDTNATNILLATRVLRTQDLTSDGAKVADAMRAHADRLRAQADASEGVVVAEDDSYFEVIGNGPSAPPELTEWARSW